MYYALLDLPSKPFWDASECDAGVAELVDDLRRNHDALLAEARVLEGRALEQGTVSSNGGWVSVCARANCSTFHPWPVRAHCGRGRDCQGPGLVPSAHVGAGAPSGGVFNQLVCGVHHLW